MHSTNLNDRFGRVARDLRVSLTDRCNLRCTYCMPEEGTTFMPRDNLLSDEDVVRLVRVAVERLGVTEVRFTGGEPLLRNGLESIISAVSRLAPRPQVSLTTNGVGLAGRAAGLKQAGLDRVNVSLDTVCPETFKALTKRDRLDDVIAGLAAAADVGLAPVKVNAVLVRGINDEQAPDLLSWCLDRDYQLRFIEQMPLDAQGGWDRERLITADDIQSNLSRAGFSLRPLGGRGSDPAELWRVAEGPHGPVGVGATVGIIASVTRPFCRACDRTRLTAEGNVRSCLFSQRETSLRQLLHAGADDEQIAELWRFAMMLKPSGGDIDAADFQQPARPMSAIGG